MGLEVRNTGHTPDDFRSTNADSQAVITGNMEKFNTREQQKMFSLQTQREELAANKESRRRYTVKRDRRYIRNYIVVCRPGSTRGHAAALIHQTTENWARMTD